MDKLTDYAKKYGAKGLSYIKFNEEVTGSIVKNLKEEEISAIRDSLDIDNNDLVLIICGNYDVVKTSLGALRCKLARDFLI